MLFLQVSKLLVCSFIFYSVKYLNKCKMVRWQMQDCSNIKRAIGTHETTLIAVNVLILQGTLRWYDG